MKKTAVFLVAIVLLQSVTDVGGQCTDVSPSSCDFWARNAECLITPAYMMCSCALSCQTPVLCDLTTSNDTDCRCRSWAAADRCGEDTVRETCPTSCDHREAYTCPAAPTVENAHAVPNKTVYNFLDAVNYNCNEGYQIAGSTTTIIVCDETMEWVVPRGNTLPTCVWIVCNTPPAIAHASWQGTDFGYNSTVVYTCNVGFEAAGGSDVRRCDGTKSWAGSNIICDKVNCGDPPDLDHSQVTFTSTSYQDVAVYTCDTGYNASALSVTKQCSEHRNWTGADIECFVVECGNPPTVTLTEVVSNGIIYQSEANYTCETGYHPIGGDPTKTCGEDGLWSGSDLQCGINNCGAPPTVNNTEVTYVNTTYRADAEYTCAKGYNPVGGETNKRCMENRVWAGADLECEVVSCGPPSDVAYTDWSAELHVYQSQASYSCIVGYEKTGGHDVKTCLDTGVWDGENLQCQIVTCGTPPAISNANFSSTNDTYLSIATYTCNPGYDHSGGDVTKSCDQNGGWQGTDIVCTPVDCGSPPEAANSSRTFTSTVFESTAEFKCIKGHNSSQPVWTITCKEDAKWQGDLPQCKIVDCGDPPTLEKTGVNVGSTVYESEATYTCTKGYNPSSGSDKKTCAETGRWQGTDLLCQIVSCGSQPEVPKATSASTGSTYGSTASYSCVKGYKVAGGSQTKTCTEFGTWNGDNVNCTIVTCGVAPVLSNAHVIGNYSMVYQSNVVYDCNLGYDVDGGNDTMTCTENGVWYGEHLRCKEKPSAAEIIGVIKKFEPEVLEGTGSVGFGVAAIVIMSVILAGILLLDLATFYKHLRYMKENLTDFWESRKPARSISLPEKRYSTDV